jgi:hypothetical protein
MDHLGVGVQEHFPEALLPIGERRDLPAKVGPLPLGRVHELLVPPHAIDKASDCLALRPGDGEIPQGFSSIIIRCISLALEVEDPASQLLLFLPEFPQHLQPPLELLLPLTQRETEPVDLVPGQRQLLDEIVDPLPCF